MGNSNAVLAIGGVAAALGIGYVVMKGRCEDGEGPDFICETLGIDTISGNTTPPPSNATPPPPPAGAYVPPPPPVSTTPPAPPPPPASTSDPVVAALTGAAAGDAFFIGGKANADHWAYYWNRLYTPLTGAQFTAAFGADRGPASMTAAEFVGYLRSRAGISGFSLSRRQSLGVLEMMGQRPPRIAGGIPAASLGLYVPGVSGLDRVVTHNFYGTPVSYAGVEDIMAELEGSWESARGNGTGYACRDLQLDPGLAASRLIGITVDHCNLAPEACQGIDIPAVASQLASEYGAWFSRTFPKGWGDCYNYDARTFAEKFPGANQADYWTQGPPGGSVSVAPTAPPPPPQIQQPPQVYYAAPPAPPVQTMIAPAPPSALPPGPSTSTNANSGGTGDREEEQSNFDIGGSFKIGDFEVPYLVAGLVAAGAIYFMARRR